MQRPGSIRRFSDAPADWLQFEPGFSSPFGAEVQRQKEEAERKFAERDRRERMSNLDIQKTSEVPRIKLSIHPGGKLPLG